MSNRSALSASGTDPSRRYSITMQRRWKKKIQGILEMTPPLRGGDFQGIAGLSSDDSLLVGVSTARERSFKNAPALFNIGSMSPARLSLSTVASPHCRLLFHLAGRILAEKQRRLSGQPRTKRLSSLTGGWKSSYYSPLPVEGEVFFLTFPFIDQAIAQVCAFSSPKSGVLSVMAMFHQLRAQFSCR